MVSTSIPQVGVEISHDARLAPIPHIGKNPSINGDRTSSASHITSLKYYALNFNYFSSRTTKRNSRKDLKQEIRRTGDQIQVRSVRARGAALAPY